MREVSIWTQATESPAKVVKFISITDGIEFENGVVSDEQKDFGRTAGTELVFVHRAWQF